MSNHPMNIQVMSLGIIGASRNFISRISLTISKVIRLFLRVGNLCFNEPSAGIAQAMPNTCMD